MIENAVYQDGLVAMVYHQPMPKMIKIDSTNYYFDCQHGIALALIPEKEVPRLLAFKGGCCGGERQVVFLANPVQYSHWVDGKGGRS